jgi:predicted RNase H-like nuclease
MELLRKCRKLWESSNGKWRIVRWPHPCTVCIEKLIQIKKYLKPQWEYRYIDDTDVPKYVIKKLNLLLKSEKYVYEIFG